MKNKLSVEKITKKLVPLALFQFFGQINPPQGVNSYGSLQTKGLIKFANNLIMLVIVGAGIFAFVNFIIAGYDFLGSAGDSKKTAAAWARIYNSLIGLLFVAGSFVLAAIFGWILFKDPRAILSPNIYGP